MLATSLGPDPASAPLPTPHFDDGVAIACNSMVRNRALLDRLKPPFDRLRRPDIPRWVLELRRGFPAGARRGTRSLRRHPSCAIRDYHVYEAHLPRNSRTASRDPVWPRRSPQPRSEFQARRDHHSERPDPAASAHSSHALRHDPDPRGSMDDRYTRSLTSGILPRIADQRGDGSHSGGAHPAFFEIDYDDYYQTHLDTLSNWSMPSRGCGKSVENLSPSHISALGRASRCRPVSTTRTQGLSRDARLQCGEIH